MKQMAQTPSHRITRPRNSRSRTTTRQQRRTTKACALLKRPKILIFNEATSNLDSETSEKFAATVNKLKGKVKMVFIAHQLPKTLLVDRVVRIEASGASM